MSKAVLISIQPHWCELIANERKTIEVRKTRPNLDPPFKCYIYCTNQRPFLVWGDVFRGNWETEFTRVSGYSRKAAEKIWDVFNGHIMGEFVCDAIIPISVSYSDPSSHVAKKEFPYTCLTDEQIMNYLGSGKEGYGWHISKLMVYDTPKELSEFIGLRKTKFGYAPIAIQRAPQSWCYVEEPDGGGAP